MVSDVNNNLHGLIAYLSEVEEVQDVSQHLQTPALMYHSWSLLLFVFLRKRLLFFYLLLLKGRGEIWGLFRPQISP